jgi:hypothetical protein
MKRFLSGAGQPPRYITTPVASSDGAGKAVEMGIACAEVRLAADQVPLYLMA